MAEIRKFKPSSGAIAQALAAAMCEPIRPVTPGARPAGAEDDDDRPEAAGPAALSPTGGWQGFTVRTVPPVLGPAGGADAETVDRSEDGSAGAPGEAEQDAAD